MSRKGGEETLFRLLTMLKLIPSRTRVSTAQLKEMLEERGFKVDLRTIQRDLKNLKDKSEFPIESDSNVPAGWKWSDTARAFEVPSMDPMAALSLQMMEQYMPRMMPKNCLVYLKSHFNRAQEVLEDTNRKWLRSWPNKVGFIGRGQPLLPAKINIDVLGKVTEGLLKDKRIKLRYSRKGEDTPGVGIVNPLGLVFQDQVGYLVCTYWEYNEQDHVRHLALHRIHYAEVLDEPKVKLDGFKLKEHIQSGAFGILESDEKIKLKVIFHGKADKKDHPFTHLIETPLSPDQKVKNLGDGRVQVEATVKNTSQLRWWLLGFGDLVEVVSPKKLRDEMSACARGMVERYK